MGLHLGTIFAFDDDIGGLEALCHVTAIADCRATHIAIERQIGGGGKTRRMTGGRFLCAYVDRRRCCARAWSISTTNGSD